jgi:acetoin utilization protein AcuB
MEVTVDEYTSPILVMVNVSATIDSALELMQENMIRHLPVENQGKVVGIVSERDLLTHSGKNWEAMLTVEDIMNPNLLSVYRTEGLGEVALQLSSQKFGSAIVLDESGDVYGIFTTTDALNALVEILYPNANSKSDIKDFTF